MEPQVSGIKTWQWVVTAIIIIILIVVGILVFGNKGTQTPVTTEVPATTTDATAGAINRIVMADQYPGNVVYLSSIQLDKPGWVVIQSDNAGQPGAVIGETYFDKGLNAGGKVTVTSPMIDGKTYYAVLYSDNGDQKFDAKTDLPLKDSKGAVILKVFHASSSVSAGLKG